MMRANPILKKELVLGSRSIKFPLALMVYSGCMSLVALVFLMVSDNNYYGGTNFETLTRIFLILAFIQLALIVIIMPVLTAGSIAGERERQTLDLLLTAPVGSVTIVLGKLMSSMCNMTLFVVSSLPAMSLAFLYGGIQWKFLLVFLAVILVTAFFCGAIGVWCASIYKRTILSIVMTLVCELIFFLGTLGIVVGIYEGKYQVALNAAGASGNVSVQMGWIPLILFLNPAVGFVDAIMQTYTGSGFIYQLLNSGYIGKIAPGLVTLSRFWAPISFIVTFLLGLLFLFLAARRLDAMRKKEKFRRPLKKKE